MDRAALRAIEKMASDGLDRDEVGIPCLQIHQRTPRRVLHRRSLIDRVRYVYNIETALINSHFFLLRLVTSAGNVYVWNSNDYHIHKLLNSVPTHNYITTTTTY